MLIEQPGTIGDLILKNRITLAPMGTNFSSSDGLITERDKSYYVERAKGGVAMIMTAAMGVTGQARAHMYTPVCYHDRFIPGLSSLVEAIKAYDCHIFGQLNHHGALLHVPGMPPVGPSAWINPKNGADVKPMSVNEIAEVQKNFANAARRLWIAGYDGVEIHAANGYLFQQFFTPRINKRSDAYGGSLENRMRFLLETVGRIQDAAPGLRVMVRFSVSEFTDGGYTEQEAIALAKGLERAGVVALDLSGGTNETPQLSKYCIQTPSFSRGCLAPYAKPIKASVSIPIFVAGRLVEPEDAEAVLRSGSADFISLGRALYADPYWCAKAFGEVDAPIRRCIACNVCHDRLSAEKDVSCVQNPMIGTEFESLEQAEPQLVEKRDSNTDLRRVLILGAGVSGVQTARIAAGHGHEVEIWEKSKDVGGQVALAVAAPHKHEVEAAWLYPWEEVRKMGVPVRTEMKPALDKIIAFAPDLVVLATGALPNPAPFDVSKLDDCIKVYQAWDVLKTPEIIARSARVTIIGGGTTGVETADLLISRNCNVTLIEAQGSLAKKISKSNRSEILERLKHASATIMINTQVLGITGAKMEIASKEVAFSQHVVGDYLVIATGVRPNNEMRAELEASDIPFVAVGDCYEPGDFMTCLRDGWMVGASIGKYALRAK